MIDEGQGQSLAKRFFQFIVHALGNSQSIKFLEIASAILLLLITGTTAGAIPSAYSVSAQAVPASSRAARRIGRMGRGFLLESQRVADLRSVRRARPCVKRQMGRA